MFGRLLCAEDASSVCPGPDVYPPSTIYIVPHACGATVLFFDSLVVFDAARRVHSPQSERQPYGVRYLESMIGLAPPSQYGSRGPGCMFPRLKVCD